MLPLRELVEICSSYLRKKGTSSLSPKELELYNALDAGKKYNSISKEMYDESPSLRSFKKLKASTYDKLIDLSLIHI